MKKILFIDRDGTLIEEPEDEQIDSFKKFRFLPGAIVSLARIVRELDFELVMVTNQDGLGTDSFPEETFWPVQNKMLDILAGEGVQFREILIDRTFPHEGAETRKPGTGMLRHYILGDFDLANSFVLGDRSSDMELARNLGAKGIFIGEGKMEEAVLVTRNWEEIRAFLAGLPRRVEVSRETKETNVKVVLDLEGSGKADVSTGLGFFDHMLEQIARHGGVDLKIQASGDLHIDEHHTIEDVALVLGSAFKKALGARKGIGRYGFFLPMDDARAQVAIDFGGRPWLEWNAEFRREKVGDVPTELFKHFFKSFSDTAACNLHIIAEGENEHHKVEAIFKGVARAIKMAVAKTGEVGIPSTKGTLT